MDRNTTVAFVLISAILIVWLYINSPEQPKQQPKGQQKTLMQDDRQKSADSAVKSPDAKPGAGAAISADTTGIGRAFAYSQDEKVITVENDLVRLELTTRGGKIKRYFLKNFHTWYAPKNSENVKFYDKNVQMINFSRDGGDFNIVFLSKDGKLLNTSEAAFGTDATNHFYSIKGKESLKLAFSLKAGPNSYIRKIFTFKGDEYAMNCDVQFENMQDIVSNYRYDVVWGNGINFVEKNSVDEANYANASAYSGDEQVIVNASNDEKVSKEFNGRVDWVALRSKYFAVMIAPQNPSNDGGAAIEGRHVNVKNGVREYYSASIKVPFSNKSFEKKSFLVYIGPIDYDILKSYGRNFKALYDFGSLFGLKFIIRPISEYILLPLFKFLHMFIPNYGWVIIVFSLLIKIALHPLTRSSLKSMRKMQLLQPKIAELKEKYKDNQQKQQSETMKLYSTYGINPTGGCLPMLLQMPILVALWSLFSIAIELRQQPFALWITNLSSPDVIFNLPFKIPLFGIQQVSGLALLLGITMFIQQKMSVKDPQQQMLIYMMPIMFLLMFMNLPSGLNLYYFMFNLFSIAQQYYVNASHKEEELKPVANPKKGGGFMGRLMEAAEKSSAQQQQLAKKKKK
ncbi:MAG: membrane protein insertase YidC [Bacteroidota bacterium]